MNAVTRYQEYELSPTQQGMLFHAMSEPSSDLYVEQFSYLLHGDLDVPLFEWAWQYVAARFDVLRSSFHWAGGENLFQRVHQEASIPWQREDWRENGQLDWRKAFDAFVGADRQRPFDFQRPPVMRLALIRLAERKHIFLWTFHHVLLDGWSLPIVLRTVLIAYEARIAGRLPALPPAPPYRDYLQWLRNQDANACDAFWRRELRGARRLPPLAIERCVGKTAERDTEQHHFSVTLDATETSQLTSFLRRNRVTLSSFIRGVWAWVLSRYSGSDDVVFGAINATRPPDIPGIQEMVGLLMNTVPVRLSVREDGEVSRWLQDVQRLHAASLSYSYAPLVRIQKYADCPPGTPLFETIAIVQNFHPGNSGREPTSFRVEPLLFSERMHYPLSLVVYPGSELRFSLACDSERFESRGLKLMAQDVERVARAFMNDSWPELVPVTRPVAHDAKLPVEAQAQGADESGSTRMALVAYVVSRNGNISQAALREHVAAELPDAMVPAAFVVLDRLPLLPNGKVNRAALPMPDWSAPERETPFVQPENATERALADIWCRTFHRPRISVHQSFFELGGDSIIAIQIAVRATEAGFALTPAQVMRFPTIAQLARVCEPPDSPAVAAARLEAVSNPALSYPTEFGIDDSVLQRILRGRQDVVDVYPVTPMQRDMVLHSLAFPDSELCTVQTPWFMRGEIELARFERAWQLLSERHAILRTAFVCAGLPEPLQVVHGSARMNWTDLDWRHLSFARQRKELDALAQAERRKPFALDQVPLWRLVSIRMSEGRFLLLTIHHALFDGWCKLLIVDELLACYAAAGGQSLYPPSPPYRDYVVWLKKQDLESAAAFWRDYLEGFSGPTPLPIHPMPSPPGHERATYATTLSRRATIALRSLGDRAQVTLSAVVQGAWALLLSGAAGVRDVVFGVTVAGRPPKLLGADKTIGVFINTVPVRVRMDPLGDLIPWLQTLHANHLRLSQFDYASSHQIRRWTGTSPHLPLFDTVVVFQAHTSPTTDRYDGAPLSTEERFQLQTATSTAMTLTVNPSDRLSLEISFDKRRFEPQAVARLVAALQRLLEAMASPASRKLDSLLVLVDDLAGSSGPAMTEEAGPRRLGYSVSLGKIESALREHDHIVDAAATFRTDLGLGDRLVAYLVAAPDRPLRTVELLKFLRDRVPDYMLPSDFVQVERLQWLGNGAVDLEALPVPDIAHGLMRRNSLAQDLSPQDMFAVQMAQIWEDVFNVRPIGLDDNFFDLGGTSLIAVELMSRIATEFRVDLPLSVLLGGATIRELARELRTSLREDRWAPLVVVKRGATAAVPFFCVHPAGGNILNFTHLARRLEPDQPFYGLQAVGLDGTREPYDTVEEMALHYLTEIRKVQRTGPYAIGGQSFGGYVAYEIARQLTAVGEHVALVALLETWSPIFRSEQVLSRSFPDEAVMLAGLVNTASRIFHSEFSLTSEEIRRIDSEARIEYALGRIREANIVLPAGIEHTRRIMKIHLNTIRAGRRYRPGPYAGVLTVFRAPEIEPWLVQLNGHPAFGDEELWTGWQALTPEPIEVYTIPGTHTTFILEPSVRLLAQHLTACLGRIADPNSSPRRPKSGPKEAANDTAAHP
jgi:thioesterase domain-containing protein/non-ribosomal peptide synthetase component F/acyl carrier protein